VLPGSFGLTCLRAWGLILATTFVVSLMLVSGRQLAEVTSERENLQGMWGNQPTIGLVLHQVRGEALGGTTLDAGTMAPHLGRALADYRRGLRVALADDVALLQARAQAAGEEAVQAASPLLRPSGLRDLRAKGDGDLREDYGEAVGDGPLTFTVTVYGCENDSTGRYACQPQERAGACGYVLNPGSEAGPGISAPSLFVATGAAWPCGTEFTLETGQVVIVADRGNPYYVHDRHLDAWCFNAANRDICLPGIGPTVEVVAWTLP